MAQVEPGVEAGVPAEAGVAGNKTVGAEAALGNKAAGAEEAAGVTTGTVGAAATAVAAAGATIRGADCVTSAIGPTITDPRFGGEAALFACCLTLCGNEPGTLIQGLVPTGPSAGSAIRLAPRAPCHRERGEQHSHHASDHARARHADHPRDRPGPRAGSEAGSSTGRGASSRPFCCSDRQNPQLNQRLPPACPTRQLARGQQNWCRRCRPA